MNRFLRLLMLVLGIASVTSVNAQLLLLEDFENGIPSTWTIRDADGLTPYPNDPLMNDIGFGVGDAWKATTAPDAPNTVAASHSWYTTLAPSNDWLITPAITLGPSTDLSWFAQTYGSNAYRDGYEVRISTTDTAIASFLANPALFTIAAESNTGANHTENLAIYANQTVYIAFRNTSLDKYILGIDNVILIDGPMLNGELALTNSYGYGFVPDEQIAPITYGEVRVANLGNDDLTNVKVKLEVFANSLLVAQDSVIASPANIPAGDTIFLSFSGSYTPTDTGVYVFRYILYSDNDYVQSNDTVLDFVYINDTVLGRDNGNIIGATLGIGYQAPDTMSQGGYMGHSFHLVTPRVLTSATAAFFNFTEGDSTRVAILNFSNGIPTTVVAESRVHVFGAAPGPEVVTFTFPQNVVLAADTYVIVAREYSEYLGLLTTDKFTPSTTFVQFPVGAAGWYNNELLGVYSSYVLRANFGACSVPVDSSYVQQPSCPNTPDGLVIVYATPNGGTLTYDWSSGSTTETAEFLNAGVYTVTVGDGLGCQTTRSYNLNLVGPIDATLNVTNAADSSSADGAVTLSATGGTAPYTYEWSNGQTTASITGLAPGAYTVTVTDANNCERTFTATVSSGVGIFNVTNSLAAKLYPNPANNQVFVEVALEKAADVKIEVVNNLGQTVISQTESGVQTVNTSVNIATLSSGIYLVKISAGDASSTQKLIVE